MRGTCCQRPTHHGLVDVYTDTPSMFKHIAPTSAIPLLCFASLCVALLRFASLCLALLCLALLCFCCYCCCLPLWLVLSSLSQARHQSFCSLHVASPALLVLWLDSLCLRQPASHSVGSCTAARGGSVSCLQWRTGCSEPGRFADGDGKRPLGYGCFCQLLLLACAQVGANSVFSHLDNRYLLPGRKQYISTTTTTRAAPIRCIGLLHTTVHM